MIKSFCCAETEKVFNREFSKKLPHDIQRAALRKLRMLNRALVLSDLRNPPSNHLELLKGDRKGQYSVRINNQWRVCFRWDGQDAHDVEIADYH
ncbi:MAG: type II toxin-antitoxin system RelE/ParE family toxin [Deltaproteobacteria bacterium]|nr:type II toxin-antitoxin system RelE/ParE family toxin [Deltaproteobacteria bacterium]